MEIMLTILLLLSSSLDFDHYWEHRINLVMCVRQNILTAGKHYNHLCAKYLFWFSANSVPPGTLIHTSKTMHSLYSSVAVDIDTSWYWFTLLLILWANLWLQVKHWLLQMSDMSLFFSQSVSHVYPVSAWVTLIFAFHMQLWSGTGN